MAMRCSRCSINEGRGFSIFVGRRGLSSCADQDALEQRKVDGYHRPCLMHSFRQLMAPLLGLVDPILTELGSQMTPLNRPGATVIRRHIAVPR